MSHEVICIDGTKARVTNIMSDGTECDDLSKYEVPINDVTYYDQEPIMDW